MNKIAMYKEEIYKIAEEIKENKLDTGEEMTKRWGKYTGGGALVGAAGGALLGKKYNKKLILPSVALGSFLANAPFKVHQGVRDYKALREIGEKRSRALFGAVTDPVYYGYERKWK